MATSPAMCAAISCRCWCSCVAQSLQEEFDSERSDMSSSHNRQKKEMADLMTAMEAEFAEADSEARQEFEAAREEIRNR